MPWCTKKEPLGALFLRERGDSKERPGRRPGKEVSGGHFFSSWESPSNLRRIPEECGSNWNLSDAKKMLIRRAFSKSPISPLAPKYRLPLTGRPIFLCSWGTRIHQNADVRWTSAAASSKTGSNLDFPQSGKCNRVPSLALRFPKDNPWEGVR